LIQVKAGHHKAVFNLGDAPPENWGAGTKETPMCPTPSLRRHAELVDRMAHHLGLDLEEAVLRGQLPPEALPDLVLNCAGCAHPDTCASLLQAADAAPRMADAQQVEAPYFCRNAGVFDDLRRA
jgi:hypothetical protein